MNNLPPVFCAIDTPDVSAALDLARIMSAAGCGIKLGLEFFSVNGPQGIARVRDRMPDIPLFLDLKFHDIPNTVAGAVRGAVALAPDYMTLHASGGRDMMQAAHDAANTEALRSGIEPPALLAVTVLTSLDDPGLEAVGQTTPSDQQVLKLARLTRDSGLPGIVCAGTDIGTAREALGQDFILMVPGIRPAGSAVADQRRIMTPAQAIAAGATHLVIGRPITAAPDPGAVAAAILEDLKKVG